MLASLYHSVAVQCHSSHFRYNIHDIQIHSQKDTRQSGKFLKNKFQEPLTTDTWVVVMQAQAMKSPESRFLFCASLWSPENAASDMITKHERCKDVLASQECLNNEHATSVPTLVFHLRLTSYWEIGELRLYPCTCVGAVCWNTYTGSSCIRTFWGTCNETTCRSDCFHTHNFCAGHCNTCINYNSIVSLQRLLSLFAIDSTSPKATSYDPEGSLKASSDLCKHNAAKSEFLSKGDVKKDKGSHALRDRLPDFVTAHYTRLSQL